MAQLSHEQIEKNINLLKNDLESQMDGRHLVIITHDGSNAHDTLLRAIEEKFYGHAALKALRHIAAKSPMRPFSAFLGLACSKQKTMFGFQEKDDYYALIAVNRREIESSDDLRSLIYRAVSESLDSASLFEKVTKTHTGEHVPILQKKKALTRSHSNLRADVFSALMTYFDGKNNAVDLLANYRSKRTLAPKTRYLPEEYPFVMAMEALSFALQDLGKKPSKKQGVEVARRISMNVMKTFEVSQIYQWWNFARPAQDMAWRGFNEKEILSLAINTSDDPHVRATGMLIADILELDPQVSPDIMKQYNAFATNEHNQRSHKKAIDELFELVIDAAAKGSTSRPLFDAANEQNLDLIEGRVLGWCAHALQYAGHAFDSAKKEGIEAMDVVRSEFRKYIEDNKWDDLKDFGDDVVKEGRKKGLISLEDALQLAEANERYALLLQSMQMTMTDPGFQNKLAIANDMAPAGPRAAPQAPSAAPKAAPSMAPAMAPAGPGLGGGTRPRAPQKRETEPVTDQTSKDDDQAKDSA